MKLEVGMYVRLKRNQGIAKIEDYEEYVKRFVLDEVIGDEWGEETCLLDLDDVLKASHNIIELIEEGDYVNGMKVNNIAIEDGLIYLHMDADDCLHESTMLTGDEIESIVTKEQFKQMQYKVGD